eukprot:1190277-Prorocentrum_minimum.AAC.5
MMRRVGLASAEKSTHLHSVHIDDRLQVLDAHHVVINIPTDLRSKTRTSACSKCVNDSRDRLVVR